MLAWKAENRGPIPIPNTLEAINSKTIFAPSIPIISRIPYIMALKFVVSSTTSITQKQASEEERQDI